MAYKKQTFKIQEFKAWVNQQLKRTDKDADDRFKAGLCIALGHVLMRSGQYQGYNHNYWVEKGYEEWITAGQPDFPEKNPCIYGPSGQMYNRCYF
jgi:hypothetical protein